MQGLLSKLQMASHKAIFIAATQNKMPKICLTQCNKDSMNTGNGTCFKKKAICMLCLENFRSMTQAWQPKDM